MKACLVVLLSIFTCLATAAGARTYVGSTPAHALVREFLQISPTDSIDFIRWKLEIGPGTFQLRCEYGLIKPSTPGFLNGQRVAFEGQLTRSGNYYHLKHGNRNISILELNENLLHFVDPDTGMLIGNGGWSYSLNSTLPVRSEGFNIRSEQTSSSNPLVFEGRTPCQELSGLLGLQKTAACNKMKWYFLLYTDPVSGKPSHFLMGGIGYKKETMSKGNWQVLTGENGRIVYRLNSDRWTRSLDLRKGDDNTLFFTDADGRLLVGNEDFSFTLNRRKEEYPRSKTDK